jgi:hypothetical protein
MSEFQYYEWQTIDRRLTPQEQNAVGKLSSHIDVTASYAQVDYSWGSFKHNPKKVLADYFDAFLYQANWGSSQLIFRFPAHLLDASAVEAYCLDDYISLERMGEYYILDIETNDEDGGDWIEPGGELSGLLPLRNAILQGDYRTLYLAWLHGTSLQYEWEPDEELVEPPLPPGLDSLDTALNNFVEFFGIDEYLIEAAATGGASLPQSPTPEQLGKAIGQLPRAECDDFLLRLLQGEPLVQMDLQRRLDSFLGGGRSAESPAQRRFSELLKARDVAEEAESQRLSLIAAEQKRRKLEALAGQQEAKWTEALRLIELGQAKAYDEAVDILCDLRDLAEYQKRSATFQAQIEKVHEQYSRRSGLLNRLRQAGLE